MPFEPEIASDDSVWDFCQPVLLEAAGHLAPDVAPIRRAKRRAVSLREQAASGGRYTGADVNWHIPDRFVPPNIKPKPGDVVVEDDGTRWTALEVPLNRVRNTWKLICRDLAITHQLGHKIQIERAEIVYDSSGVATKVFPPDGGSLLYCDVKASVQPETADTEETRGIRGVVRRFRVTVERQLPRLNATEDRIRWADGQCVVHYLDIVSIENQQQLGELPFLIAEIRP